MCVICIKPKNVAMPSEELLSNMWCNNPDGAGIMYAKGGMVHIEKGMMTYNSFCNKLDEIRKTVDLDKVSVIMHFRITTHGGTKPENCHPFPVTDSVGLLQKKTVRTKLGVAHNGIISITPRKGISDTMEYIVSQLGPLHKAVPQFYRDKNLMQMISNAIDSKMAFMDEQGKIYTIGNFVEEGGIKYSNTSYKAYRWSKSYYDYYDGEHWTSYWTQPKKEDETYWDYREKALMWLDEDVGDYVKTNTGSFLTGDLAIDCNGKVYQFSESWGGMVYRAGWTAYSGNTGGPLTYKVDSDMVFMEAVFEPVVKKGGYLTGRV